MTHTNTIRQASVADIPRIIDLLHQVDMVHHRLRPDLFKPDTTKYDEQELAMLLEDKTKPIKTARLCILMTCAWTKRRVASISVAPCLSSCATMPSR